jgi:hypothetical protein
VEPRAARRCRPPGSVRAALGSYTGIASSRCRRQGDGERW